MKEFAKLRTLRAFSAYVLFEFYVPFFHRQLHDTIYESSVGSNYFQHYNLKVTRTNLLNANTSSNFCGKVSLLLIADIRCALHQTPGPLVEHTVTKKPVHSFPKPL